MVSEIYNENETEEIASRLASSLVVGDVLALYGDLGAGKTTFTKFLVKCLGFEDRVQSPTFIIIREYKKNKKKNDIKHIYHVDLYRLQSTQELVELDLNTLIHASDGLVIIEWPEIAESLLPANTKKIKFEYINEETRKISLQNIY